MSRLNFLLVVALVLSSLLLITSQHKARKLLNELELEQDKAKQLDVEWGQLQLEQSTWATPSRVKNCARKIADGESGSAPHGAGDAAAPLSANPPQAARAGAAAPSSTGNGQTPPAEQP